MAKKPGAAPKKKPDEEDGQEDLAKQAKSARKLLLVALVMSVASLGGGFMLARMAYKEDAANFEPKPDAPDAVEVVDETEGHGAVVVDPADAHGGHGAKEAGGGHAAEAEKVAEDPEGLLEFGEIVTNITSHAPDGTSRKSFLKLGLYLVYRPEPGAKDLMKERKPFMRDLFTGYLRGLTEADLRGAVGLLNVKAELLKRARAAVGSDLPQEILISDLIVQ
ncbi:MAG: flagellar basal body protein FliL [Alphaproteobacteria bacterium]|nr:MAG: flagellar basal body protein FliL [Alphaproteobacteria bacterium]